jgi:mannose-6-phosphate isomerase-like protein (cupin superfamily)
MEGYLIRGLGGVEIGEKYPTPFAPFYVVYISAQAPQRIKNIGSDDLIFLCICTPRFRPEPYEKLGN